MALFSSFILLNSRSAGGQLEQPSDVNSSTTGKASFVVSDFTCNLFLLSGLVQERARKEKARTAFAGKIIFHRTMYVIAADLLPIVFSVQVAAMLFTILNNSQSCGTQESYEIVGARDC